MNWKGSGEDGPAVPTIIEPELGSRPSPAVSHAEGDWLCAWCYSRVANEQDRFNFDGKSEFTFTNPEGARFEIILFSDTEGCRQTGLPTLEYTWFPGHRWSYCHCAACGQHIGWFYSGEHEFAGLIRSRIIRAVYVRN